MIALFTDFGIGTPYAGQVKTVLAREAPDAAVIDLCHDLPPFNARAAAYLLPALVSEFPADTVFICVVDPGVGAEGRRPAIVRAGTCWFVGPDNGIFNEVARRADRVEWWDITWRPQDLSASFHGRDLFAPVAAQIALGGDPPGDAADPSTRIHADWPADLAEVIYVDRYGNAVTGLRTASIGEEARLVVAGRKLRRARTFADVSPGEAMWYENSNGLAEIAVNQGDAARALNLSVAVAIEVRN